MKSFRPLSCSLLLVVVTLLAPACVAEQVTTADYARAEQFLSWNAAKLILNARATPQWIGKSSRFYYVEQLPEGGHQFILVDASAGSREPAFDHLRLAEGLSRAAGKTLNATKLPFAAFEFVQDGKAIQFNVEKDRWNCNLTTYACERSGAQEEKRPTEAVSPDKRWAAYIKDHNLYVRPLAGGPAVQLTTDGQQDYDYASQPGSNTFFISTQLLGLKDPAVIRQGFAAPALVWSPDSKRLVSYRLDQRKVQEMYLLQSAPGDGSVRPILRSYRAALPGDKEAAAAQLIVFDVTQRTKVTLGFPPQPVTFYTPFGFNFVSWDKKGQQVYLIEADRSWKTLKLSVADAKTGASRTILKEEAKTYIEPGQMSLTPLMRILGDGDEALWFSERDGWGHLYLYDLKSGALKNQVTSGQWVVSDVLYVDEAGRWVYFTAMGREKDEDPYLHHLYRAKLDGSNLELLTPEHASHAIDFSPDGKYIVDSYSKVDQPTISVLRAADGRVVRELERADISALTSKGWKPAEAFSTKAADGTTDIYGLIYRPTNFDPAKKYPVLDSIYPGPHLYRTPKGFAEAAADPFGYAQSLAELGFVLVSVDGRGTPGRSKAFHDYSYGKLGSAGCLEDHVAAIRKLAETRSYMDLDRVGIYGHSGGGYASVRAMLAYPDFYKVAVASAGNQDQRGYIAAWGEKYQGPLVGDNYLEAANVTLAANLKGKLLLVWGEMDDNVPPALELQLVSALIKANRNFDMLTLPNRNHNFAADPYFIRRLWDYFVEHLLGVTPPEYKIQSSLPGYRTLDEPAK
jgi:dipeptidyl aminopeptidase/acylaminoacyl peptidase